MPASAVSSRPQTLRQARRAYQKAGATTRLSDRQMRQIERGAELQERADRIKERENKRKANLKKKNERIEREREARARMGIPSPVKEDVGASQLRLGAFMAVGFGMKTTCEQFQVQPISAICSEKAAKEACPAPKQNAAPARSPLQPQSGNGVAKSSPRASLKPIPDVKQSTSPSVVSLSPHSPNPQATHSPPNHRPIKSPPRPPKPPSVKPPSKPPPLSRPPCPMAPPPRQPKSPPTKAPCKPAAQPPKVASMPPPPRPTPRWTPKPPFQRLAKPPISAPPKPPPIVDEWAAFLVSNTQIERELSTPEPTVPLITPVTTTTNKNKNSNKQHTSTTSPFPTPTKPPVRVTPCRIPLSTEALLAQICTQDLQFTQAEDQDPRRQKRVEEEQEQDFDDDITDNDLEGAALEAEKRTEDNFCFCDDDFSTQELRELVD